MKEIITNLYVGNQEDFETGIFIPSEWSHLLAAKEPWHRSALGYSGRAAAKDHPEYLMAKRDNKLILNLVDAPKSIFFSKDLIDEGIKFIEEELGKGKKVSIHCNMAESRSPSIALLYLVKNGLIKGDTLEDAEAEFLKLYPEYNPGEGIRGFVKANWDYYKKGGLKMPKLNTIQKRENLNEVHNIGDIGPGDAYHHYIIYHGLDAERDETKTEIKFQKGPRNLDGSIGGVIDTDLLEIVRHRLQCFQAGPFSSEYNEKALEHIELALMYMNRRVEDRIERNVLGTNNK